MIGRRVVLAASLFALGAAACSALIAAQLDAADAIDAGTSSGRIPGTSSGTATDPCALVTTPDASLRCAECIETNCAEHVAYACDGGTPKRWFSDMRRCAESPHVEFGPDFWECRKYLPDAASVTGTSESAMEAKAHECIRRSCLYSDTLTEPPCRQCPVYVVEPGGNQDRHYLGEAPCGKCLRDHCEALITVCCDKRVIDDHVRFCAFTEAANYKVSCNELSADAAPPKSGDSLDVQCERQIRECFRQNCETACQ